MMTVAWAFIRPFAFKLLLGLAVIGTVLAVIARLKHAGRLQERVEAQSRTIEQVKRKKEIRHEIATESRRPGGKSARDRLRDEWQRD
jgi:hypothetical protein